MFMNKLDLHGKSHADVAQLIDRFIWDSMRNKRLCRYNNWKF